MEPVLLWQKETEPNRLCNFSRSFLFFCAVSRYRVSYIFIQGQKNRRPTLRHTHHHHTTTTSQPFNICCFVFSPAGLDVDDGRRVWTKPAGREYYVHATLFSEGKKRIQECRSRVSRQENQGKNGRPTWFLKVIPFGYFAILDIKKEKERTGKKCTKCQYKYEREYFFENTNIWTVSGFENQ